ncbi:MAG: THUMP-like domain-containing protein [Actinomycetales bacterium]
MSPPPALVNPADHSLVDLLDRLRGPDGALLADLAPYRPDQAMAAASRARRQGWPGDLVALAQTQLRLRAAAEGDLGELAATMFFTDAGLQQATRWVVAGEHAARFTARGASVVADLGCGIGVDSLALLRAGLRVVAVERDPFTAAVARANLAGRAATVLAADVHDLEWGPGGVLAGVDAAYLDPARRDAAGRRILDPRRASPSLDFITALADRLAVVGAKVAPGIDHALVPDGAQAQWISADGALVEATVWFGMDGPARSALLLRTRGPFAGARVMVEADPSARLEPGPVGEYLVEPDSAVIRAGALGVIGRRLDARLLDPTIAYLSCDRSPEPAPEYAAFAVQDRFPFSLKSLRSYLRDRQVGVLTIKKRGTAVDPAHLRRQLRLSGRHEATIVLTRVAGRQSVLVVDPLSGPEGTKPR